MTFITTALRALRRNRDTASAHHRPASGPSANPAMSHLADVLTERETEAVARGSKEPDGSPAQRHWFNRSDTYGRYALLLRHAAVDNTSPTVLHRRALHEMRSLGRSEDTAADTIALGDVLLLLWVTFQIDRPNGHNQPDDHIGADTLLDLVPEHAETAT